MTSEKEVFFLGGGVFYFYFFFGGGLTGIYNSCTFDTQPSLIQNVIKIEKKTVCCCLPKVITKEPKRNMKIVKWHPFQIKVVECFYFYRIAWLSPPFSQVARLFVNRNHLSFPRFSLVARYQYASACDWPIRLPYLVLVLFTVLCFRCMTVGKNSDEIMHLYFFETTREQSNYFSKL